MTVLARVLDVLLLIAGLGLVLLGGAFTLEAAAEVGDPNGDPWAELGLAIGLLICVPGVWFVLCGAVAALTWRRGPRSSRIVGALGPGVPGVLVLAVGFGGTVGWQSLPVAAVLLALAGVHVAAYVRLDADRRPTTAPWTAR